MVDAARKELDFYRVDLSAKGRPDPGNYAQYRCTTAANAYSRVQGSYYNASGGEGCRGGDGVGVEAEWG